MAEETCIVCLGSIPAAGASSDVPSALAALTHNPKHPVAAPDPADDDGDTALATATATAAAAANNNNNNINNNDGELVAFLLPCGHFLHDECLKPWVERANSCPICRGTFNMVELRSAIGGPLINSYAVADRVQVAELDPALLIDDGTEDVDEHDGPCMVCETFGNEADLLLCDGCNNTTHVCCAGLDRVPAGTWFCYTCQQDAQIIAQHHRARPRGRGRRPRQGTREAGWERVWQSILVRTAVDIDFPFEEEASDQQIATERRGFREWQARFNVAERQGAASRFRNTAPILHNPSRPRSSAEEQEESRAWSAFDRARLLEQRPSSEERPRSVRGRKRKSRSNTPRPSRSPREATPPPTERKLKRPRVALRRSQLPSTVSASNGESSRSSYAHVSAPSPQRPRQRSPTRHNPTFLQSLLTEVEANPRSNASEADCFDDFDFASGAERSPSPQDSSRAGSPQASNHPSPRAMTPPPHSPGSRPVSPPPLASTITPIFPPAPGPEFSPFSPAVDDKTLDRSRARQRQPHSAKRATSNASDSPSNSPSHSPTRPPMSYEMKQEIQKMVAVALRPFWHRQEIDKEKFTEINREVSRMLYEKVWDAGGLVDHKTRERWQNVAIEEVKQAVRASRPASRAGPRPSSRAESRPASRGASRKPTPSATSSQTTEVVIRPGAAVRA